jgi:hypothetical protein
VPELLDISVLIFSSTRVRSAVCRTTWHHVYVELTGEVASGHCLLASFACMTLLFIVSLLP